MGMALKAASSSVELPLKRMDVAISQLVRCHQSSRRPTACSGPHSRWGTHRSVSLNDGPGCPLMGYAARSATHRYVAWLRFDGISDKVDWAHGPYIEELYDAPRRPPIDFDAWDLDNLLYPTPSQAHRATANAHLRALHAALNRRLVRMMGRENVSWLPALPHKPSWPIDRPPMFVGKLLRPYS